MELTPIIAIHMSSAIGALVIGPVVLWSRLGQRPRPWLHRALGYAWTTLMVVTATSAVFIRDFNLPNIKGYTPIHLLIFITFASLLIAFRALAKRDLSMHRKTMQSLYLSACVVAGGFTLVPSRYLGQLIWHEWLGWV